MSTNPETNGDEIPSADALFIIECLKHLNDSKQVDIGKVATALNYSNVASAGNRFRALRKRYGFPSLECKNSSSSSKAGKPSAAEAEVSPSIKPGRKSTAGRKGAKVTSKPIPATGPVPPESSAYAFNKATKSGAKGRGKQAGAQQGVAMESVEIRVKKETIDVKDEEGAVVKTEVE